MASVNAFIILKQVSIIRGWLVLLLFLHNNIVRKGTDWYSQEIISINAGNAGYVDSHVPCNIYINVKDTLLGMRIRGVAPQDPRR